MTRGEKVLVALTLLCALGALIARPLLAGTVGAALSPRLAMALADCGRAGTDGVSGHDPWGRAWCVDRGAIWSAGPDGEDQGGAGDDLLRGDAPVEWPPWWLLASPGETCVGLAIAFAWALVAGRLLAGSGRGAEPGRALLAFSLPGLVLGGGALAVLSRNMNLDHRPSPVFEQLPWMVAGSAGLGLVVLGVLWWQVRREATSLDPEERSRGRRGARRWLAIALLLLFAMPLLIGAIGAPTHALSRDHRVAITRLRLIALAQARHRETSPRYATAQELVAAGRVPAHFFEHWHGYAITVQLGQTSPDQACAAVADRAAPVTLRHFASSNSIAIDGSGVIHVKTTPIQLDAECNMDPAARGQSW